MEEALQLSWHIVSVELFNSCTKTICKCFSLHTLNSSFGKRYKSVL